MSKVELTTAEANTIRQLLKEVQRTATGNLRVYNLCRRVLALLGRAERRRNNPKKQSVNNLLRQASIINEIFENYGRN
jgi:hypothetical protein